VRYHRVVLLAAIAATLPVCAAAAHPHVFITNRTTLTFDEQEFKGITFQWTFDPMFSAMILGDYDPGHTGKFDAAHAAALKAGAFDNLVNYHYFVAIWVGGKPIRKLTIQKFTPSVSEQGRLVYRFFVPVNVPLKAEEQTVLLTVYDDSYYVAFDILHTQDVAVESVPAVACALSVQKTRIKAEWPGQYMPDQLVIRFKETS